MKHALPFRPVPLLRTLLLACAALAVLAAMGVMNPRQAHPLAVSKGLPFYARDMEFYYREQREEALSGILRTFDAQGVLADRQKQLMLAAFLAEVLRQNPAARQHLLPASPALSRDGQRTLAWMAHLAQLPDAAVLLNGLLQQRDALLRAQIDHSPAPLLNWDISSEKTVLQMYWAAFMASGSNLYLDSIIRAALRYARLNAEGKQNDPAFPVCAAAAASLYELTPRHTLVSARVEEALRGLSGPEAETLRTILRK